MDKPLAVSVLLLYIVAVVVFLLRYANTKESTDIADIYKNRAAARVQPVPFYSTQLFTPPYMVFHPVTHDVVTPGRLYIEHGICKEDVNGTWVERPYTEADTRIGCFEYENGIKKRIL